MLRQAPLYPEGPMGVWRAGGMRVKRSEGLVKSGSLAVMKVVY